MSEVAFYNLYQVRLAVVAADDPVGLAPVLRTVEFMEALSEIVRQETEEYLQGRGCPNCEAHVFVEEGRM